MEKSPGNVHKMASGRNYGNLIMKRPSRIPVQNKKDTDGMKKDPNLEPCDDLTQKLNIRIPCRLAQRIEAYAQ
jgi:hypothetical protein